MNEQTNECNSGFLITIFTCTAFCCSKKQNKNMCIICIPNKIDHNSKWSCQKSAD